MRYKHTGNVHKDFHLAGEATIRYVLDTYGGSFLEELFRRTAQKVYRDIYGSLVAGDYEPLLEHWAYYYERESGDFRIERLGNGADFHVLDCPALRHVEERNGRVDDSFRLQFELLAAGFAEGTPFAVTVEATGPRSYTMSIRRSPKRRSRPPVDQVQ